MAEREVTGMPFYFRTGIGPLRFSQRLTPRKRRRRAGQSASSGKGCLIALLVVGGLIAIGAIANAVSGSGQSPQPANTPVVVASTSQAPTPTPTLTHHRRHHHHHHAVVVPAPTVQAPATQGCTPTTASGNCYEPGEYCPEADAGMHGVAGDG